MNRPLLLLTAVGLSICVFMVTASTEGLTPAEATAVIEREAEENAARQAARRAELESADILSRTELQQGGRTITFNRIRPPQPSASDADAADGASASASTQMTDAAWEERIASQPKRVHLSLWITVYDSNYSEVAWHDPENPKQSFTIWTNLDLNPLGSIHTFDSGDTVYSYFAFTRNISREADERIATEAARRGFVYESRWRAPPFDFTSNSPEYVVATEDDRPVPPELYTQMTALFGHYLANEPELRAAQRRQQTLSEARRQYQEAHPPLPEDATINFYPLSERKKGASK